MLIKHGQYEKWVGAERAFVTDGPSFVMTNVVSVSVTFAALSDLSRLVKNGITYGFTINLFVKDLTAQGIKLDLAGGSAVVTNLRAAFIGYDNAFNFISHTFALATVAGSGTGSGFALDGIVQIIGTFQATSDGTFIPRIAQLVAAGSLTVYIGSSISVIEIA